MYDSTGLYRTKELDNQVISVCEKLKLDQAAMKYAMRFLGSKQIDDALITETKEIMKRREMSKRQKERNELKKKGKNIKYIEGEVYVPLEDGKYKWIEHAWNLIDGKPVDFAYGENNHKYKGHIVKDEYMNMLPKWMHSFAGPEDVCDVNVRVGDEFGNKAYE